MGDACGCEASAVAGSACDLWENDVSTSNFDGKNDELVQRYLGLMKKTLVRWAEEDLVPISPKSRRRNVLQPIVSRLLSIPNLEFVRRVPFDPQVRANGRDWPSKAETMIGLKRLDNIQYCVETIIREDIPGDLVETGVWRGGASIFMAALLKAFGDKERKVWCADSFQGLPTPDLEKYPQDEIAVWHQHDELAISLEEVKENFSKYDLLDGQVQFLVGWFKDTLPTAAIDKVAVLRLDGDMYESTMDALNALYEKVSVGGFVIVDDYGLPEDTCRRAIHDFRDARAINDEIIDIDGFGAFWRRSAAGR